MYKHALGFLQDVTHVPLTFFSEVERDIFARTLYGEAGHLPYEAKEAIALLINNRKRISKSLKGYWWGNDTISICQKMAQFSCWDRNNQEYFDMIRVTEDNVDFRDCLEIVDMLPFLGDDRVPRATHYYDAVRRPQEPAWAEGVTPVHQVSNIKFYNLINI